MSELDFIYKRKSIRDYKDAVIPKEDILKMLDAATHAPSPKHQQNWHFVVVQDKEIINKMAEAVSKSHEYIASLTKNEDEKKKFMRVLPYYINFQRSSCAILVYANEYKMVEEKILRENNICDRFDIIFEERENKHSHVWIIPRYAWMNEICDRIIKNIGTILDYAKKNFRTRDVYEQISQITKIVKKNFASKKYN